MNMNIIGKTASLMGYVLRAACVTHCALEYGGDLVMVCTYSRY